MKNIRKILFIFDDMTDPDPWVFHSVKSLAETTGAEITCVRAVEEHSISQILEFGLFSKNPPRGEVEQHLQDQLESSMAPFTIGRKSASGNVLVGTGFVEIIKTVLRENIDLVIKQRHQGKGIDQLAQKLFRKCPCPVLVLSDPHWNSKNVLAAIDIEATQEESIALNRSLIEVSSLLAKKSGKELHLINGWNLQLEMLLHGPRFNATIDQIIALKSKIKSKRESRFASFLKDCGPVYLQPQTHIAEGTLEDVITEALSRYTIGTLVMGSIGRYGAPGVFIGNSAEKIIAHADCTILAIKPAGFVSPVTL